MRVSGSVLQSCSLPCSSWEATNNELYLHSVHAVRPSGEQRASRVAFGASRAIMEHSPPRPAAMGLYFSDAVWAPASPPLDTDSASDESLDIVDLSWSPEPSMIAPTTPWCNDPSGSKRVLGGEHSNTLEVAGNLAECNGHDFGKETRPRGEPEDRIRRDILQEWIEPLNNEFASAQDLLDAFSTTPPSISRAASPEPDHPPRQNAGRLSQADAVCKAPSLIGDHGGTVHKFEPVWPFTCTVIFETPDALSRDASRATEDVRYSPKQCTAEVSSLNQPTHTSRRASFWGSSFGGVRSVTDDAFSKLAHDLASKLAQRRAWESRGSERKGGACDEVSAQSAGAPVIDPAPPVEDNSGLVSRMKVLREQASNSIFPAGPASAKTHCDGIQKCDDAAKRRVSSETKRIFLSGSEQTLLHAKGIADGPDSLAGAERRPDGSQKSDPAKRNACENQTPSSVTVRILEAKMLAARKFGGLPDPCCWISLHRRSKMSNCSRRGQGCQSEVTVMDMKAQHAMRPQFKSAVVKQARDPVWNSSISLSVAYQCTSVILDGIEHESATSGALSGQAVNLFLTVHDHGARHSFLGQAAITDISPGAVVDRWVTLQRRDGSRQMDSRGRVSSVRVKIDYACNQATSDVKSRIWGPSHHLETDGPCDQDCLRKAHDRISKSPYQFRASVEQRTSVETLQSVVRRVLSTRVFRLTLLQSRFLKTELEGHKAGSRKLEVADVYKLDRSKSENTSTSFEIAAEIITGASDYDVTAFANDVSVRQTDTERKERHEMTDYALRNRSSLGQDLGMGLQDENGSQEQARKYLDESWGVLQSILPADLQNERACWVMQRLAKCGQFQDRPDVAALSGTLFLLSLACTP